MCGYGSFLALKHYKEEDYIRQNFGLLLTLKKEDVNGNFTKLLLVYLLKRTEIKPPELSELLKQVNDHQTTVIMNSYDMLIEKGKIEGEKIGEERGEKKGIRKG